MIRDGIPKLLVARNGHGVDRAKIKNLTIDSTKNTLKKFNTYSGTLTSTTLDGNVYDTITHNLGYQPVVLGYTDKDGGGAYERIPLIRETPGTMFSDPTYTHVYITRPDDNSIRIHLETENVLYTARDESVDYSVVIYIDPKEDIWYE